MTLLWYEQLAWIAGGAAVMMVILWIIQYWIKDAGVVDVGWAAGLGASAVFCAWSGEGEFIRRCIVGAIGGVWGFRLAIHLLTDRVLSGPEDGRYQMMRERFDAKIQPVFLIFFLAQALLVVILSAPFVIASQHVQPGPTLFDGLGVLIWVIGLSGESLADQQLKVFKRNSNHRGRVCTVGLWRYSRHPNYFFEWLMWVGYALLATGAATGWLAWSAPALILLFVLKLTGIPPTEARALKTRGEAYREYQRTTSAFVPWFPKQPT